MRSQRCGAMERQKQSTDALRLVLEQYTGHVETR